MDDRGDAVAITRAAILTGEGRGAVGVVRIWGRSALAVASNLFEPKRGPALANGDSDRPRFGRFGGGDEVVALLLDGPDPAVEIHGHGGSAALRAILAELEGRGVVISPAPLDPVSLRDQAEADLARAETLRVAAILIDQVDGALDREFASLRRLAADGCGDRLARELLDRSGVGVRMVKGWKVVLTGRPNVGKSRLLNAIAGFDRSIVSPTAGTTRDVVTARSAIDGWPVELADTAGLRVEAKGLEALGIGLARDVIAEADLVLMLFDRAEPLTVEDHRLLGEFPHALRIASKADLPPAWFAEDIEARLVSAETGEGLDPLLAEISARIVPRPPPPGSGVPFRPEHVATIREVAALA